MLNNTDHMPSSHRDSGFRKRFLFLFWIHSCSVLSLMNRRRINRDLYAVLGNPKTVNLVSVAIFVAMTFYIYSDTNQDSGRDPDQLVYPWDIMREVRAGALVHNGNFTFLKPAYVKHRNGTFRTHYPSRSFVHDTFDEIFVITNRKCAQQTYEFSKRALERGLQHTTVEVTEPLQINLNSPPLRINESVLQSMRRRRHSMLSTVKRQIGYTHTHIRIWQQARLRGRQRILILDDTLFPNARLIRLLPLIFNQADEESIARHQAWHFISFRRTVVDEDITIKNPSWPSNGPMEVVWSSIPVIGHPIVQAAPSYGSGFYALSSQGIDWMLEHLTEYTAPLDEQISSLQRQFSEEFIALSGCNNVLRRNFCPEIVLEIIPESLKNKYECTWRRLQEKRIIREITTKNSMGESSRHPTLDFPDSQAEEQFPEIRDSV